MGGNGGIAYHLRDYSYNLPEELIAQVPSSTREASRLLVLDRSRDVVEHRCFNEVSRYLRPGDLLVVNDTRVVPARLHGNKETGGRVELLVLDPYKSPERGEAEGYRCLVKAAKRTKPGSVIELEGGERAKVLTPLNEGKAMVRFLSSEPLLTLLDRIGEVPLPPYIRRDDGIAPVNDSASYQTVYASSPGAVAAPTAGLHFSDAMLQELKEGGIEQARVTLHVGYGTFAPIRVEDIRDHEMHSEYVEVSPKASERIGKARKEGRRVVAVGTTVVRTLEWVALKCGALRPYSGLCNHYIYPGYRFQMVDAMITNFHLPQSTLLLLVSAFAGRERILKAYGEAIDNRYRFFSYGDAMLIL
ncbi:tRNA preQ1(34) S-adenosylmethionine ribosyltransferase-isomerase QueA [Desulforhabdus amnigena]|jgi:S-adenosylmethionine:tRNA ribosyltransferase-isomerase|uniref:S-adenosylmethionine:tRNA ribosyltransferase-isomerase n=1 Tax=Desulforhabdus amnigena TaxID=40218 RepID=A0A9W6FRQ5_9BACT|nr:tRNA preQ1(34) S-adenosylmethionine ribosyltransferase-isomerase QueA [Desulforhabdus amnigena]NLJ26865.1 tRNA preQ1(34) S-adenosylmethionine ribosyltransferase-isomerase QueA [Deltaproteobacteria bacterium]GLI33782.1 S-adenosylmethionine:tRNA ribosyltransferase-isomerase [Desulforhabdus amnigena]